MFDRTGKEASLGLVEQHISEADVRICKLMDRIDLMQAMEQSWEAESELLVLLIRKLKVMEERRRMLLDRLYENT